jgi:hypothetical protein
MRSESKLFIDLWDHVRDLIPVAKRIDVAFSMLQTFIDHGHDLTDFADITDEEAALDRAYDLLKDEDEDEDISDRDEDEED